MEDVSLLAIVITMGTRSSRNEQQNKITRNGEKCKFYLKHKREPVSGHRGCKTDSGG
jgi:hypothetical protein